LNRYRSQTPYSCKKDTSLNRDRGQASYFHQEGTLLNGNGSQTPYFHWEDTSLNIGKNRRERRERNIDEESHRRIESGERDREGNFVKKEKYFN
jgi:hypothetical protein